jgi:hypothetical protein
VVLVPRADPAMLEHPCLHLLGFVPTLGVVVGAAGSAGTPVVDATLVVWVGAREPAADGTGSRRMGGHRPPFLGLNHRLHTRELGMTKAALASGSAHF